MQWHPSEKSTVLTSSIDGSVRIWVSCMGSAEGFACLLIRWLRSYPKKSAFHLLSSNPLFLLLTNLIPPKIPKRAISKITASLHHPLVAASPQDLLGDATFGRLNCKTVLKIRGVTGQNRVGAMSCCYSPGEMRTASVAVAVVEEVVVLMVVVVVVVVETTP